MTAPNAAGAGPWLPGIPLVEELPEVDPFTEDLLPPAFAKRILEIAKSMYIPLDGPATAMVTAFSGAVGRRATIQPKEKDWGWSVVPNLWGALIADPSQMKSPQINQAIAAMVRIEDRLDREWKEAMALYQELGEPEDGEEKEPPPERGHCLIYDCTWEKAHELLCQCPNGLTMHRDELTGLFAGLKAAGAEKERSFWLVCWSGDQPYGVGRISRGLLYSPALCLALYGGIQPQPFSDYLNGIHGTPLAADGLVQRMQLMAWPDPFRHYEYVDCAPDPEVEATLQAVFDAAVKHLSADRPMKFRFSEDAQEMFQNWYTELQLRNRVNDAGMSASLISHLGKYASLMPSLALLFELSERLAGLQPFNGGNGFEANNVFLTKIRSVPDWPIQYVSVASTALAIRWCGYLESHARRVYACMENTAFKSAVRLREKITNGDVAKGGWFTARHVYNKDWSGLNTPEKVEAATKILEKNRWIRKLPQVAGPQGGRPSIRWEVNPSVRGGK